ncbi:MAG: hydroxymyristoyl-ACP dehydratase [Bacteroides sp.]|nr:hydroxymyristoyl-ACP dehydratase [Bacteroides sp.]
MLVKDFYWVYSTEAVDDATWSIDLELNASHPIYEGHFPETPILPGVVTLQIIKECAEEITKKTLQYIQIGSCKFLSAINPTKNSELQLTLTLKETEENKLQLLAEGMAGENSFIKLKATLVYK